MPTTSQPEFELEEQVRLAEDAVNQRSSELENRAYSRGTIAAAEAAFVRRGLDLQLISSNSRSLVLEGFARLRVEEARFALARLLDPLAKHQPTDSLFVEIDNGLDNAIQAGDSLGIRLASAIDEYLKAKMGACREKTHRARERHLGYLSDFLGGDTSLSSIEAAHIRAFRNALPKLRANHGRQKHLSFQERLTENGKAQVRNKTARLMFEPIKAFFRWAKEEEGSDTQQSSIRHSLACQTGA